jgi:hypothetical protein
MLRCLVFFVVCCLVLSCVVLSCVVLCCLVLSCLVLSCLVLSCLVLSCLVLSCDCLVLSCRVFFCLFWFLSYVLCYSCAFLCPVVVLIHSLVLSNLHHCLSFWSIIGKGTKSSGDQYKHASRVYVNDTLKETVWSCLVLCYVLLCCVMLSCPCLVLM